jgi:hypothetical protein
MNISTLEAYVEQENKWAQAFNKKAKPLSLLNAKDRQRIAESIDCRLSPENLTCDGELSRAEVQRRYKNLTRCAQELMSIDPSVKIYELSY